MTKSCGFVKIVSSFLLLGALVCLGSVSAEADSVQICRHALETQLLNLSAPNAAKMLDAWGKIPSGVIGDFNGFSYGSFSACSRIGSESARYCVVSSNYGLSLHVNVSTTALPIPPTALSQVPLIFRAWGICIPAACQEEALYEILQDESIISPIVQANLGLNEGFQVVCPPQTSIWDSKSSTAVFALFVIIGAVGLFCSIVDEFGWAKSAKVEAVISEEVSPLIDSREKDPEDAGAIRSVSAKPASTGFQWFVETFSFTRNFKTLITSKTVTIRPDEPNFTCLEGFKVFSTLWVIIGHMYWWLLGVPLNNMIDLVGEFKKPSFLVISNAFFSVDTFFFFSGFLAAFTIEKRMTAGKAFGIKETLTSYVLRYIRIVPSYMLVILYNAFIFQYTGSGPFWNLAVEPQIICRQKWWQNILFIDDLMGSNGTGCTAWGWYLSNDFQFFIITPILMILIHKSPRVGSLVWIALLTASIITCAILSVKFKIVAFWIRGIFHLLQGTATADDANIFSNIKHLYFKPWARIQPYLIGVLAGYLQTKKKIPLPKERELLWMLILGALAVMLSLIFGLRGEQLDKEVSVGANALYNSTSRAIWGLCLWIIVSACINNRLPFLSSFMGSGIFQVLSRVSLLSYLIHPVVLYWMYYSGKDAWHFSASWITWNYVATVGLVMPIALVVTALVESPLRKVSKLLIPTGGGD